MKQTATDYAVLADIMERVGGETVRSMMQEIEPRRINWKRIAYATTLIGSWLFWVAVAPPLVNLDLPAYEVYPVALANFALLHRGWWV